MTNEEIGRRLVASKAIDFKAVGALVSELGPELVVSGLGHRVILFGRHVVQACILQAGELGEGIGGIRNLGVADALKQ